MSEDKARPERIPQRVLQRDLGQRIADLRRARGWKQRDLAERLGVPEGRLGKWERGWNAPSLEDLRVLAIVLEVTYQELMAGGQSPARPLLPPTERTELGVHIAGFLRVLKPLMERPDGKPGAREARQGSRGARA